MVCTSSINTFPVYVTDISVPDKEFSTVIAFYYCCVFVFTFLDLKVILVHHAENQVSGKYVSLWTKNNFVISHLMCDRAALLAAEKESFSHGLLSNVICSDLLIDVQYNSIQSMTKYVGL